ncbi:2932_t:CDS:2 [Gigaspora margarita]|uniref:2932_t:CDS:1 n=1 Tax=Gigaspora margarita TaxID=4874 RepID=A0ABM8VZ27_GIGMA|nr:2932_t:CDS:2 [Gigaspora margarita]
MILGDLFQKNRRTEPVSIYWIRVFVIILLLAILTGYILLIGLDIYNDQPIINNSFIEENSFLVPAAILGLNNKTRLSCFFVHADNGAREYDKDCLQYINQPIGPDEDGYYQSVFYNNSFENNLVFSTSSNKLRSSHELFIGVYEMIPNSTIILNEYSFDGRNTYRIKIKRRLKEVMMPSWKNYFGFPVHEKLYYITSTSETLPSLNVTGISTPAAAIILEPESFITQVESDQRTKTVLSSLGLIGGAWGIITSFYAFLFGNDTISPWGIVQKYCLRSNDSVQEKFKNNFNIVPLVSHLRADSNNKTSIQILQKRLEVLQLFLSEYAINLNHLEKIQKKSNDN